MASPVLMALIPRLVAIPVFVLWLSPLSVSSRRAGVAQDNDSRFGAICGQARVWTHAKEGGSLVAVEANHFPPSFMPAPYQLLSPDARKEIVRRKTFYESKAQECAEILRALDALPSFFDEHPIPDQPVNTGAAAPADTADTAADDAPTSSTQHRRKEDLYDEEMLRLLQRVKVASKLAVFQHFHTALRGNTSIGAVESYLKRAVLRGIIVRRIRGEYTLPPQTD
jgi:hypothetical protein